MIPNSNQFPGNFDFEVFVQFSKLRGWHSYVQFQGNWFEFGIIENDFWSSTIWAIQIHVSFTEFKNPKTPGIHPTYRFLESKRTYSAYWFKYLFKLTCCGKLSSTHFAASGSPKKLNSDVNWKLFPIPNIFPPIIVKDFIFYSIGLFII